jgi:phosphatidylglycerol:prolipoprotein diacylglycerol transferase
MVQQRLSPLKAADALVLAWVPSIAIVRAGCFLNGCCYGRPTTSPLGLVAGGGPNTAAFGIPSHPAQLYAAAAALLIYAILRALESRLRDGEVTAAFLGLLAAFVFVHEFFRGDPRPGWIVGRLGTLSLNQIVSLPLAIAALAGWVAVSCRRRSQAFLRRRKPTIAPTATNSGTK